MDNRYIHILSELSKHGIEQQVNLRDFIIEQFNGVAVNEAHAYLEHMVLHRHIRFNYNTFTIYPSPLILAITLEGEEYLSSYYLKKATLQSFKNQRTVNIITWAISIVSIAIALFFGLKSNLLETQVGLLQKRLEAIEKIKGKTIYHTPIHPDTIRQLSPKKK